MDIHTGIQEGNVVNLKVQGMGEQAKMKTTES